MSDYNERTDFLTDEEREKMFQFLNNLRESNAINMFAAPAVLERQFGLSTIEAVEVFFAWTEWFSDQGNDHGE